MQRIVLLLLCATISIFSNVTEVGGADKPHIVFVTGDHEYGSERTMPLLAKELEKKFGMKPMKKSKRCMKKWRYTTYYHRNFS